MMEKTTFGDPFKICSLIDQHIVRSVHPKSTEDAEAMRKKGNDLFRQKDSWKALESYCQSVTLAPNNTESLALAYGNRSAALFELGYYEECLRDIDRSMINGLFPEASAHKLISRKLRCLVKLGGNQKLKADVERLTLYLSGCQMDPSKKGKVLREAESLISDPGTAKKSHAEFRLSLPLLIGGTNPRVNNLSSFVKLEFSPDRGRHLVTIHSVKPGQVLIAENPFVSVLLQHCSEVYCHQCQRLLPLDVVPCESCSQVRYCSEACRDTAEKLHHWLECGILDILYQLGIAHLALRIVLCADASQICGYLSCEHLTMPERKEVYGIGGGQYMSNYDSIFHLETHADKVLPEDETNYRQASRCLTELMKHKNYFDGLSSALSSAAYVCEECKSSVDALCVCFENLLYRHILQLICNAHAITTIVNTGPRLYPWGTSENGRTVEMNDQVKIATAIYPCASLMNHACEPNVFTSFLGNAIIVRATANIPLGCEALTCYGPRAGRMLKECRQEALQSQYFFTCKCIACCDESRKELAYRSFQCASCGGPVVLNNDGENVGSCMDCKKQQNCLTDEVKRLLEKLVQTEDSTIAKTVNFAVSKLEMVLYKHNKRLSEARDHVARLLAEAGLYVEAEELVLRNLPSVKYFYGDASVEVGNELQKLIDVQVAIIEKSAIHNVEKMRQLVKRLNEHIDDAVAIFAIHYGEDCSQVEDLYRLRSALGIHPHSTTIRGMAPL